MNQRIATNFNSYGNYYNAVPQNYSFANSQMVSMPNQEMTDSVSFAQATVVAKPEKEETFLEKHGGKLLLGAALIAGAALTQGKLWGKASTATKKAASETAQEAVAQTDNVAEKGIKTVSNDVKPVEVKPIVNNTPNPKPIQVEEIKPQVQNETKKVATKTDNVVGKGIKTASGGVEPVQVKPVTEVVGKPIPLSNSVISKQVIEPPSVEAGNLPIENRNILFAYKGTGYFDTNMNLRSGLPLDEVPSIKMPKDKKYSVKDFVNIIDDSFKYAVPIKNDIIVHRGETHYGKDFLADILEQAKSGHIQFKAYTSTSLSKDIAIGNFSAGMDATLSGVNAVRYKIKLPKDSKVLDYSSLNLDHGKEMEFLLPRNANFKVLKINEPYAEDIAKIAQKEGKSIDSCGKLLDIELEYIP